MAGEEYLSTPEWRELTIETVLGRPVQVWKHRHKHVLDLLDLAPRAEALDLLVQGDRRVSFRDFHAGVETAAVELARLDIGRGDRILLILYNRPEVLLAQWGAFRLGAVPVFGNRWWSDAEAADVIARVRPKLIITDLPLAGVDRMGAACVHPDVLAGWWSQRSPGSAPADPRSSSDEDDLALIVFTAGSTGAPKGVQLTHRVLVWSQQTIHNMRGGRPPLPTRPAEQKVTLMTTPMFHNGAIVTGISALIDGNRTVMLEGKFMAEDVLGLIERERVTAWQAVPTMFARMLQHSSFASYDLSSLVAPSSGGTHVPEALIEAVDQRLPNAGPNLVVGYGMTEMSFLTMATRGEMRARSGTVGKPIPGVEMRVDAPDASGQGELLGRSAALMIGYLGTADQPIDAEGWYHTGDLGRIDADGYVYVTGRVKDMIIRGGENIACAHVEAAILEHPSVLEVAVAGHPDEQLGEVVAAFARIKADRPVSEADLAAFARSRLAYFCVPTLWSFHAEPLPVLPTGKIDKLSLQRMLREREGADG